MIFITKNLLAQDTRQYFQRKHLQFKSFFTKKDYQVLPKYSGMTIFFLTYIIDYIINLIFREPCQRKRLHKKMDKVYLLINFEKNSSILLWGNALSYVKFTMESQHKFKGKDHRITFFPIRPIILYSKSIQLEWLAVAMQHYCSIELVHNFRW